MDIVTHTLDIKGPAQSIPDHLEIDVSDMGAHTHVTAGEVAAAGRLHAADRRRTPSSSRSRSRRAAVCRRPGRRGTAEAQPADAPTGLSGRAAR